MRQDSKNISIPLQEAINFPKDVEIGKFYMVPCIQLYKGHYLYSEDNEYIPINTHLHDDKKIINFEELHWHIDWRFIDSRFTKQIKRDGLPIDEWEAKRQVGLVLHLAGPEQNLTTQIHYKRLKCKRGYLTEKLVTHAEKLFKRNSWPFKIGHAFCNAKLKEKDGQLICPHKGAVIDKNCKDKQGNYVCPAHLLRFDPVTLKVIPELLS